ncbi:PREDICTED: hydroxylysine kinase-like isoform X4 [Branchiostoma belcheri]|uniref:Hydroxylysine kinase n=1 Tax=Branchiostoma belcheri TaxID=7741 RepID=A0A6P4ZQ93_BRABE|nr:PREDICTED: hydroxylysine kinase-like isoform X4 [Branchiostoma belcheri]
MQGISMAQSEKAEEILEKPHLTEEQAGQLVERLYGLKVKSVKPLDSYYDMNFYVTVDGPAPWAHGYTLKVTNGTESKNEDLIEAQNKMMAFLADRGFPVPRVVPNLQGRDMSLEQLLKNENVSYSHNIVRLLTYLPGTVYHNVPVTHHLAYEAGAFLAKVQKALRDFSHPALHRPDFVWSLRYVPSLEKHLHCLKEDPHVDIIREIIQAFREKVLPRMDDLQQGYESVRALTPAEWDVLYYCVAARALQSYVLGHYTASLHPENTEYLMFTAGSVWKFIELWWGTPKEEIYKQWRNIQNN